MRPFISVSWNGRSAVTDADYSAALSLMCDIPKRLAQATKLARVVQAVGSASIVAVSTRLDTARARSLFEVTNASAWSMVSATYSAS